MAAHCGSRPRPSALSVSVDEPPVTISATSCRGQYLVIADRGVKHSDTDADAKIEILTPQNALITTVTSNYFGKARLSLEEGPIRG